MWLTPWGFTDQVPLDHSDMMAMGNKATDALTKVHGIPYEVGPSSTTIYYTSGTSQDWARGIAGIKYSVTVELRDKGQYGHLLPPEQIIPSGQETFEALKVLAREVVRQNKCVTMAPVTLTSAYTPLGDVTVVNGMETYETRDKNPKTVLIGVYDIYGFSPSTNIWQICDKLAESGVRVVLPDFFRGEPWKREHYPYPTDQEFYEFVRATSWEESVRADVIQVLAHYKQQGVTQFGIFGFCFGGKQSALATGEFFEDIKVAAHFHPASVNISDANLIRSPTILLPGANDPDMTEYCQIINANNGAGSCDYIHYRDVNHGYAGGRADWTNATVRGRAEEAVTLARNFFCEKLK
jgi:dienelactone hydrolase